MMNKQQLLAHLLETVRIGDEGRKSHPTRAARINRLELAVMRLSWSVEKSKSTRSMGRWNLAAIEARRNMEDIVNEDR